MLILAIETSCDETAVAVVENGRRVVASVIASQIDIHQATGGVVPEVAAREHVLKIRAVIEEVLKKADLKLAEIDAFAVTQGPGLLSSLIIGYSAAVTLARVLDKPLIPVHHVAGHIYSNWLEADEPVEFPVMILTVSGGHNELVLMKEEMDFELIGETLDDAAGEAYDKVARLLGLGYPGGPAISKVAEGGNSQAINFTRALSVADNFDFSFSGLKSAVLREVEKYHQGHGSLDSGFVADCAASFQESVNDSLSEKLLSAAEKYGVKEIHLAGGVSANKNLRAMVEEKLAKRYSGSRRISRPSSQPTLSGQSKLGHGPLLRYNTNLQYCTDNAAMIGAAAYFKFQKDPKAFGPEAKVFPEPQLDLYLK